METRSICKMPESPTPSIQLSTGSHSSLAHESWKILTLKREMDVLKTELSQSRHSIDCLQERERKLKERYLEERMITFHVYFYVHILVIFLCGNLFTFWYLPAFFENGSISASEYESSD